MRVSLCRKVQFNKNRLESLLPTRPWARQQGFRYKETQTHTFIGERAHGVITDTATTDSVVEAGRRELRRGWASDGQVDRAGFLFISESLICN